MMTFFKSLSPLRASSAIDTGDELKVWQERILQTLFLLGSVIGLIFSIYYLFLPNPSRYSESIVGFLGLFLVCLIFFVLRKITYWIRSIISLVIVFLFANILYFQTGWTGVSLTLLLVFSFLSTTLLYQTPSRIGFFISLTTLLFWATLRLTNIISGTGLSSSLNSLAVDLLIVILAGFTVNLTISSIKSRYINIYKQNLELIHQKEELNNQFTQQTDMLQKRVSQLRTAAEINSTISSIQEPQVLIRHVCDSLLDKFDLYYVGVFLVDPQKEFAVLQYGTGEAGRKMVSNHHRLAVGGYSMIGLATQTRKSRIALDTGAEAVRFDNPLLPETRSELALPIATQKSLYGALTIQSVKANAFDDNDIIILQSVADSLAISLENNNSFIQTQKALEDVRSLNKAYIQQAWGEALENYGNLEFSFDNPAVEVSKAETKKVNVPLYLRDEKIGEIELDVTGGVISPQQREFLDAISAQTSMALENARLIDETQRSASKEQKLNDLSNQFSRALTIEEILKTAVIEFGKLPSVAEASISLIPPEDINIKPSLSKHTR